MTFAPNAHNRDEWPTVLFKMRGFAKVEVRYDGQRDCMYIPESVEELILLGDGDSEPFLTECAMERAARRYGRQGRVIRIAFAPSGLDFNDVLRAA